MAFIRNKAGGQTEIPIHPSLYKGSSGREPVGCAVPEQEVRRRL